MKTEVLFDIPYDVAGRIATGSLKRVGGVIREVDGGKIFMHLREVSATPMSPAQLPSLPFKDLLGMAGSAASILNLGATVAFGVATLRKLDKIEKKLEAMNRKLDVIDRKLDVIYAKLEEVSQRIERVQWTIELGFANTLQSLDVIKNFQEVNLAGELNSAASMAWSCQFLEPGSNQRMTRMENAFHTASSVKEKLLILASQEMQVATDLMNKRRASSGDFSIDEQTMLSLYRLRQTVAACALSASISAEADDIFSAGSRLSKENESLSKMLGEFGSVMMGSSEKVYAALLSPVMAEYMPPARIDTLSRRFDAHASGLFNVIELMREKGFDIPRTGEGKPAYLRDTQGQIVHMNGKPVPAAGSAKEPLVNEKTPAFFGLVDGIYEDLDRLQGYESEYKLAAGLGYSIHEYRDEMRIDSLPDDASIAFIRRQ